MITTIHQFVHGYRRGHEQLAASTRLPAEAADLVTRLSDLSGSLTDETQFAPYITAFPIPGGNFYALARTWRDENAPRAGCVITHTVLIPMAAWKSSSIPQGFLALLAVRPNLEDLGKYGTPIQFEPKPIDCAVPLHSPKEEIAIEFVAKFFCQGLRPLVWFDEENPEDAFWLILTKLWPALRSEFACCTFSLQPRVVEEKPFDLMFAPTSAYRRFHKLPRENLLGVSHESSISDFLESAEGPWCREWTKLLFQKAANELEFSDLDDFREFLGNDPTTIKKLFLIKELRKRIRTSPTAGVGLMDLVEAIAPEESDAQHVKRTAASLVLETVSSMRNAKDALSCFSLISERLSRNAFKGSVAGLALQLSSSVASRTVEEPESALKMGESLFVSHESIQHSAFAKGVMEGLVTLGTTAPDRLDVLHHSPTAAPYIILEDPLIAYQYLLGMGSRGSASKASENLVSWISSDVPDREMRKRIRNVLLPQLGTEEEALLLEELLRDVSNDEVFNILETLSGPQCALKSRRICQVASERLSLPYPDSVRCWARDTEAWSTLAAPLVAATYSRDPVGLKQLQNDPVLHSIRRADILGAFIDSLSVDRLPLWFKDNLKEDPSLLVPLLALGAETPKLLLATITNLLNQVKDLPIARENALREQIALFTDGPFGANLVDQTMRSVVGCFMAGEIDLSACKTWHNTSWGMRWLLDIPGYDLKAIVTRPLYNNTKAWERAWTWLAEIPAEVFRRTPLTVLEIAQGLISFRYPWTQNAVPPWIKVLRRANKEAERSVYLRMCAHALQFSFEHHWFEVGVLVIETFQPVYDCIAVSKDAPPEVDNQFGVFGWDKGKELRKDLVYSFMHSKWQPGDLVLAVRDDVLFRKIFKRIMRQYKGEDYVAAMVEDLRQRGDAVSKTSLSGLRQLVDKPDFNEDWD